MSKLNIDALYPQRKPRYVPVTKEEAAVQIAIGVHTGLQLGSEAPSAGPRWKNIGTADDSAWMDAAKYCVDVLEAMDLVICRKVEP